VRPTVGARGAVASSSSSSSSASSSVVVVVARSQALERVVAREN